MTTYDFCAFLIRRGRYAYNDMCTKLDVLMINDRITAEQYAELVALMTPPVEIPAEPPAAEEGTV